VRLGLGAFPQGVGSGQVLGGAALSGIGFTVSLLIADLAFDAHLQAQATVGVLLAAALATGVGWLVFKGAATLPLFLDRPVDPDEDHIRGPADAALTLVEYGDFECPFCSRATGTVRELKTRFGDELRYVFRHLPLPDVHPHAELAAQAAESATTSAWTSTFFVGERRHVGPYDSATLARELEESRVTSTTSIGAR
jgi:protein-disulfide isomerase